MQTSNAIDFLKSKLKDDMQLIGKIDDNEIERVADAWMNDQTNSQHRYEVIKAFKNTNKILDMASGAGTFVFYGLLNGYDVYGIDPEVWKHEFNFLKAKQYGYPEEWNNKFSIGVGESLPYQDNEFDFVSTYQTLEHVQDVKKCLKEIVRVTKNGGGAHIMCPDYRSTYEGHYRVAWLPMFPRALANIYLRLRGYNPVYLTTLNYVTGNSIRENLAQIQKELAIKIEIVDLNKSKFEEKLRAKKIGFLAGVFPLYWFYSYCRNLFKREMQTNLLIRIEK